MEKEIVSQVQEAQRIPYMINPRRNMPRHTLIKLSKIKHKKKNIKSSKGKATYKGNPICLTAALSAETLQAKRKWQPTPEFLPGESQGQKWATVYVVAQSLM